MSVSSDLNTPDLNTPDTSAPNTSAPPALLRLIECEPDGLGGLLPDLPAVPTQRPATGRDRREPPPAPGRTELQRLLYLLLEVLDGRRPVSQLRGSLGERAYDSVLDILRRNAGRRVHRTAARPPHISRPSAGAFELSLTICEGRRYRAAAARVELRGNTWLCTRFHLL